MQLHVHVCWILLMREGLYHHVCVTVCVCMCVCVCSSGNDWLSYLTSMGRAELLVMHVMSCTVIHI